VDTIEELHHVTPIVIHRWPLPYAQSSRNYPGEREQSNKTKKRRGHRKGTNRVSIALRMAARSAGKTMTPLGLFYRRIRSRLGGLGAVKATAHKLACLVYRMLKYGEEYVVQSMEEYEAKIKAKVLETLKRKAEAMGFQLTPKPTT
jgi:transposase